MQSHYCYLQVCKANESGVEEMTSSTELKDQCLLGDMLAIFNFVCILELENLGKKYCIKSVDMHLRGVFSFISGIKYRRTF